MTKKANNKIAIPWYRRNVRFNGGDDMESNSISFNLPANNPRPNPTPRQPVRQPVTVPVTDPVRSPVTSPVPEPSPLPNPFPNPIPLPERNPNNPNPAPQQPAFPSFPLIPEWVNNPNYDWEAHWKRVSENLPQPTTPTTEPNPENNGFFATTPEQMLQNILKPIVLLFVANEAKNQWIEVNITDPVYNEMLKDPVLGSVLREAEKANLDAEQVGTILANFDWENGDYKDLEKQLIVGVGAAGAARLLIFIIGRKVAFRI